MKTSDTLNRRQTALETLRSSGALFHWHPAVVDAALDLERAFSDLDSLIRKWNFSVQCAGYAYSSHHSQNRLVRMPESRFALPSWRWNAPFSKEYAVGWERV
jgi:hypothetical protein